LILVSAVRHLDELPQHIATLLQVLTPGRRRIPAECHAPDRMRSSLMYFGSAICEPFGVIENRGVDHDRWRPQKERIETQSILCRTMLCNRAVSNCPCKDPAGIDLPSP